VQDKSLQVVVDARRESLFPGVLKNVRSATLAASLVPVAMVAAQPATAYAQCDPNCGGMNCPPTAPEPAALLLLGSGAAALALRQRRRKKAERDSTDDPVR
jgi:hypothetical protein